MEFVNRYRRSRRLQRLAKMVWLDDGLSGREKRSVRFVSEILERGARDEQVFVLSPKLIRSTASSSSSSIVSTPGDSRGFVRAVRQ